MLKRIGQHAERTGMPWFTKDHSTGNDVKDFDRQIRSLIAKHAPADVPVIDTGQDALQIGSITTNLGNLRKAWAEHQPEERLPWLERTVIAFVDHKPIPNELNTSRLRPGIRSRTTFELAALQFAVDNNDGFTDASAPAMLPIAADLAWVLIWDTPATMGTINKSQLDEWNAPFDELLDIAKSNLAMEPFLGWNVIEDRVYSPMGLNDYDGTRVFLPGALSFLPFETERVVFQPTRTACFIADADDPEGLVIAAQLALQEVDAAHQVSFTPVVGYEGDWRPLELEPHHPAYAAWRRLITLDRLYGYDAQKAILEEQLRDELFIAKFSAVETNDGLVTSYCTWSAGVPTLLPVADVVAFYSGDSPDDGTFMVPWAAAVELVGHLIEPTNHYPTRFRVMDFPTPVELDVLRGVAVTL